MTIKTMFIKDDQYLHLRSFAISPNVFNMLHTPGVAKEPAPQFDGFVPVKAYQDIYRNNVSRYEASDFDALCLILAFDFGWEEAEWKSYEDLNEVPASKSSQDALALENLSQVAKSAAEAFPNMKTKDFFKMIQEDYSHLYHTPKKYETASYHNPSFQHTHWAMEENYHLVDYSTSDYGAVSSFYDYAQEAKTPSSYYSSLFNIKTFLKKDHGYFVDVLQVTGSYEGVKAEASFGIGDISDEKYLMQKKDELANEVIEKLKKIKNSMK